MTDGQIARPNWIGRGFLASCAILCGLIFALGVARVGLDMEMLPSAVAGAILLSLPQLVGLYAAVSPDRHVSGVGAVCAFVTFGFAVWAAVAIFTSSSSTAAIGLLFFPLYGAVAAMVVIAITWVFSRIFARLSHETR